MVPVRVLQLCQKEFRSVACLIDEVRPKMPICVLASEDRDTEAKGIEIFSILQYARCSGKLECGRKTG